MITSTSAVSWTGELLLPDGSSTWAREARRLVVAVGLAALFGLALGLRAGGAAIFVHAAGAALGLAAAAAVGVPALAIVLALADAPLQPLDLARAASRGAATSGLVLAGLAPGAAMFVVTVEDAVTVTVVGAGSLALAAVLGARAFSSDLAPRIAEAGPRARRLSALAVPAFLVFVAVLAARVWWLALPVLGAGVA